MNSKKFSTLAAVGLMALAPTLSQAQGAGNAVSNAFGSLTPTTITAVVTVAVTAGVAANSKGSAAVIATN